MNGNGAVAHGEPQKSIRTCACSLLHIPRTLRFVAAVRPSPHTLRLSCRAVKLQNVNWESSRLERCLCTKAAADTQAAPFRRRGRRYRDSLLDNVEPDQADSSSNKKQRLGNVQGVDQRQRNRQSAFPAPAQDKPEPTSSSDTAEEAPGWGEGQVPDDWGWGLDNPTLAAAAGSYESELQAQLSASSATYSQPQSAASPVAGDDVEPEDDWDDDMAAGSDVPDPTPDVTVLSRSEADQLLKITPQQQQVQYYNGTPVDLGVRVGTGLVLTIAASKLPLLAAGTLCYPLWWPVYKAWSQNQKLRSQYRYVGLWQTNVLSLDLATPPGVLRPEVSKPVVRFLFGDDSSARTQVDVPYNQRYEDVRIGESAELLLLSNTPNFSSFKALKEVYLPESGVWVATYPFVDRDVFLDISLDIARERHSQQEAQWPI